ncbi:UDP-N-acetylmuramate--L-alanyl-gamma-D-glutamyl-meso-2,6-diaminoheptandioate ligase [Betaproteobacteria bacterium]|nr:UDP-N-acetylmuramate--L-alanyl-gamma-D-glutamyl-meso-2,6-diaminoheptandioate ligase [Betaproteobacteria bacterium]GHT92507.1 UDP-N-acetylmuramate--L-alanyl-gamma-D-glutamyl-meso-2,6-diaminoheptandioate ligase [Betaproteobacteria bacterium]GHU00690.1 UDP-N-acetylmuramate--L-alanyl-gamma-D-glutamyl-meso-2,6-diaminoheptandioate ligase [Betaproteobacteria bacterium]GHU17669.1 UDP-N-acetylmuramate--L-alanyl-gamma-D-glutamyl-meso-2,6-diaminoheptandioate ligase [Betaproteobacteria bacterium]GHU2456
MHIHILGICGTFMGGVALLARAAGHIVTGCDANVYPPMSTQLVEQGVVLTGGYDPAQVELMPDLFVIGNAVSRGNPLLETILDRGLPYVSGPQWLAENVLAGRWVLAVAGTHGKTTTASLLAWVLESAGLAPSFLIGGVPQNFGVSARLTESLFFVIEADEYDTAFCDKRSKFIHYRPRTLVLNNLEFDHADIFTDLGAIETQFHHLVRTLPSNGRIIANAAAPALGRVIERGCWTELEWFGQREGWTVAEGRSDAEAVFSLNGKPVGRVELTLAGQHNRENALAAVAAARHVGVSPALSIASLAHFGGVKRRLEIRGTVRGVTVYDDFAHHPTAIALTVAGLRQREPRGRILAVLEPRSNTMKQGVMKDQLPASLAAADRVYCYTKGLEWDAAATLAPLGARQSCHDDLDALVLAVALEAQAGDHVLVMSNGGFGGVHQKLLDALGAE